MPSLTASCGRDTLITERPCPSRVTPACKKKIAECQTEHMQLIKLLVQKTPMEETYKHWLGVLQYPPTE